jgi:hypothetical protein
MSSLVAALIGISGVLLGATSQFLFGQLAERRKHFRELRSQAYVAFISAVAALAHAQRQSDAARINEALRQLTEAKARISIYGAKEVAQAIVNFAHGNQSLVSFEGQRSFLSIVYAMRHDVAGARNRLSTGQLAAILVDTKELGSP